MKDIKEILDGFHSLDLNEQAWVMTTLLDFRQQNLDEFTKRYGTYACGIIEEMVKPVE